MNSSIRFASPLLSSETSRNVSMWRSGMTRMCVSACGLMSLIAMNPFVFATYAPSRTIAQNRHSSGRNGKDALLGDGLRTHADERADRRVDEERRVVVAVPAARTIDEDVLGRPELRVPAPLLELAGERPQARSALLLLVRRNAVVVRRPRSRSRRVREDVRLGDPRALDREQRVPEGGLVLGGEAHDRVARQVELARKALEPRDERGRRVAAAHRAQHR